MQIYNSFSGAGLGKAPDLPGFVPTLNPSVGVVREVGHTHGRPLPLWESLSTALGFTQLEEWNKRLRIELGKEVPLRSPALKEARSVWFFGSGYTQEGRLRIWKLAEVKEGKSKMIISFTNPSLCLGS